MCGEFVCEAQEEPTERSRQRQARRPGRQMRSCLSGGGVRYVDSV